MEFKLEDIKGVGPYVIQNLRNHGIWSIYDLLLHIPKSYEDFSLTDLSKAKHKEDITIEGVINTPVVIHRFGKVPRATFSLKTSEQTIQIVAFGKSYLVKNFSEGDLIVVKGIYHLFYNQISATSILKAEKRTEIKPRYDLDPLYDKTISSIIQEIYDTKKNRIYEIIPDEFVQTYRLISRDKAYQLLHLPTSTDDIYAAKRRMKYEEAFFIQLKWLKDRPSLTQRIKKDYDINRVKALIDKIPYTLTKDQKETVNDIFKDFKKPYASYRLVQGDVGSGKTIVALIAAYAILTAGQQVALMAPTELLANQHYQLFSSMINDYKILRLTSSTKNKEAEKKALENKDYDMVIGTHALIEQDVSFMNLGLVIIDEQHKFGVMTRQKLIDKAHSKDVLFLTATPIPRTLAMIAYGESHVSSIKEKPNKRQMISTVVLNRQHIEELIEMIGLTVEKKEHIFVVVPAIHSETFDDNIITTHKLLRENVNAPIYLLHGERTKEENEASMKAFIETPGSILLATQMIEVGIDLPTATLMAIFSAERFGLAQLHQLRGRVGRSHLKSYCYLVSNDDDKERLEILKNTQDGFILSEYDLKSRGPGDFIGVEQSGFLSFKFIDLQNDYTILMEAQKNVLSLLERHDFYTNPKYRYLVRHMNEDLKI